MEYLIFALVPLLGSIIQTTMGFGNGVLIIAVFPFFLPFGKAVAYNLIACLFLTILVVAKMWRKINWKFLLPIILPMMISSVATTFWSASFNQSILKIILAVVFIMMVLIFLLNKNGFTIKPTTTKGIIMGMVSGTTNGLIGIGGPPAALYFRPAIKDNEEYIATIQCYFIFQSATGIVSRMSLGMLDKSDILPLALILLSTAIGSMIGKSISGKIKSGTMQKYAYVFIGLYGIYLLVSELINIYLV